MTSHEERTELVRLALRLMADGHSQAAVAHWLDVPGPTLCRWVHSLRRMEPPPTPMTPEEAAQALEKRRAASAAQEKASAAKRRRTQAAAAAQAVTSALAAMGPLTPEAIAALTSAAQAWPKDVKAALRRAL